MFEIAYNIDARVGFEEYSTEKFMNWLSNVYSEKKVKALEVTLFPQNFHVFIEHRVSVLNSNWCEAKAPKYNMG